jgi:N-acetylglutamate synthase-like GNAT family acetyltransferase
VVALRDGIVCGAAALKAESIESHKHLSPWAAAGFVNPALRGQGIGLQLLHALEVQAQVLNFPRIYCGTSSAGTLLQRANWRHMERITHEGKALSIYEKAL